MSKRSSARIHASASAGDPVARDSMPQASRCAVRMRRLVALSSTTSTRLPRSDGCTPLRSRRVGPGDSAATARIVKRKSLPDPHLARDADPPAHQLGQPLADRQTQTGAAVAARGRGVDLAERLEQAVEPVRRDADAGVADREGQLVKGSRVLDTVRAHREHDLAPLGELHRVREQVQEDLAQARHVADDGGGSAVAEQIGQVEALLGGPGRHEVERPLDALAQIERLRLQLEPPGLDLREVEDVVDDGQERVAALADDLRVLALLVGQRGVQEQPAHPDHGVHRRPDLVAHRRQERALGLVGRLGLPAGLEQLRDVVVDRDGAHLGAVDDHRHGRRSRRPPGCRPSGRGG